MIIITSLPVYIYLITLPSLSIFTKSPLSASRTRPLELHVYVTTLNQPECLKVVNY